MNPGEIGMVVGAVVAAIATAVGVVMRSFKQRERRRRESEAPPEDVLEEPRKREPTGRHRVASVELADASARGEIQLITEILVSLQQNAADAAGDRVREMVSRETVARIAELVEQLYTSHQRRAGEHERALRQLQRTADQMQRTVDEVLIELRRRENAKERG